MKKQKPFGTWPIFPRRGERLSAREYLHLQAENPALIERAEFVPPQLGEPGFGSFDVRYARTLYGPVAHG